MEAVRVDNPPNPYLTEHREILGEPPVAELEIYEDNSKQILSSNDSPDIGFSWSINPYRGCWHACSYCVFGDTPIAMANGRTKLIADIFAGDEIYGTVFRGGYRRFVKTKVLHHWRTIKPAYRVILEDGTDVVASADHRFLTRRGWKYVTGGEQGTRQYLTPGTSIITTKPKTGFLTSFEMTRVTTIESLGKSLPMFDMTTGTGDFIANGVVSHNCYARRTHEYFGLGAGTDFERKIFVKKNAPELLEQEFEKKSWKGERIVFSGVTDCYQPLEAAWEITRRCLEVCLKYRNAVTIITKSALVRRDAELLAELHRRAGASVFISAAFLDEAIVRLIEPGTPTIAKRFETMKILADAGVMVGLAAAPIIPGLNDRMIPGLLKRAKQNGASLAFYSLLRLPGNVREVFLSRLRRDFPLKADHVEKRIRDVRGGKLNDSRFGHRYEGHGSYWQTIQQSWALWEERLGFNRGQSEDSSNRFCRPKKPNSQAEFSWDLIS